MKLGRTQSKWIRAHRRRQKALSLINSCLLVMDRFNAMNDLLEQQREVLDRYQQEQNIASHAEHPEQHINERNARTTVQGFIDLATLCKFC